jgi:hypothetical protein
MKLMMGKVHDIIEQRERENERRSNAASQRHHRANLSLSPERREDEGCSNTASKQQRRANNRGMYKLATYCKLLGVGGHKYLHEAELLRTIFKYS